jgi:hypothetical protein
MGQLICSLINAADKCKNVTEFSRSVTVLDAVRCVQVPGQTFLHTPSQSVSDIQDLWKIPLRMKRKGRKKPICFKKYTVFLMSIAANFLMSKLFQRSTTFWRFTTMLLEQSIMCRTK